MRTAERCGTIRVVTLLTCTFALLGVSGCNGSSDTGASGLNTSLDFMPPAMATGNLVWIEDGGGSGDVRIADVVARDIPGPFDAYAIEVSFDPSILEAVGVSSGSVLSACSPIGIVEADNISSGLANMDGAVLFSAALTGSPPPPCSVTGTVSVAHITFRALGRGDAPLGFIPYNGDPNSPAGSLFYRRDPQLAVVPVQFYDSGAVITVSR